MTPEERAILLAAHDFATGIRAAYSAPDEWRARAEKAEAALDRVRALCDEWEPSYDAATGWVGPAHVRAVIDGGAS